MVVVALVLSVVALLVSAVVGLAVMELIASGLPSVSDSPEDILTPYDLPGDVPGTTLREHGLPVRLASAPSHVVLFVSPVCRLCGELIDSLEGEIPPGLTVAITAADPARQRKWAVAHGLDLAEVVFDDNKAIVDSLGVTSSPTAVAIENGTVRFAAGVGGPSALRELLDAALRQADPTPVAGERSSVDTNRNSRYSRRKQS